MELDETRQSTERSRWPDARLTERVPRSNYFWNCRNDQQYVSDSSDEGTNTDRLETTPFCVGNDSSKNGDDVSQKCKTLSNGSGGLTAQAQSSGSLVRSQRTLGNGTSARSVNREGSSDEVSKDLSASVV
jgi:hypothetical protein